MTFRTEEIVRRARSLVGVRFRSQGRDPTVGLDCVGVILNVFDIGAAGVRRDYRLRGSHGDEVEMALAAHFRRVRLAQGQGGDVILLAVREDQPHLAIHCGKSFIHADARLRRVVETPGEPLWPTSGIFRTRARTRTN